MTAPTKPNPIVFIHGLWIHSAAWQPWQDLFATEEVVAMYATGPAVTDFHVFEGKGL